MIGIERYRKLLDKGKGWNEYGKKKRIRLENRIFDKEKWVWMKLMRIRMGWKESDSYIGEVDSEFWWVRLDVVVNIK